MPINTAQGLDGLSEQQAIQQLQGSTAYQNLGTLTPFRDDRYGANGEGNGAVKTADGQELVAIGDGSYGAPLSEKLNVGGRRGAYVGRYDPAGKLLRVEFQPEGTGLLDKYGWLAPLIPVAAWALGPTAGGAAELSSADAGVMGFGNAGAPITQSLPTSFGAGSTVADVAAAAAAGTPVAQLAPAITSLLKTMAPAALKAALGSAGGIVDQVTNALGLTGGDTLGGLLTAGGGLAALGSLKDASNTAADAYGGLGDSLKGQYQYLGDKAQGLFSDLGATGRQGYENLGMKVGETYNGLADTYQKGYGLLGDQVGNTYNNLATQTEGQYKGLADRTKAEVGKFTPYNITTNVGSTNDKGTFTASPGMQGVSDSATKAAQSSFDAGNAIDVNNLAGQRYDLMQSIFAPGDNAALTELRANQQARGRSGVQSLNMANSVGGTGANPAEVAYYKALGDRNLKAQATAADQALAQRGGLLSQGSGATQVPLAIGSQGLQQIQTGVQAGNTAFQNNMAGTQLGAGIERSGLDAGTQARMTGAGATTNLYRQGLDTGLNTRLRGADQVTGLFGQGLGFDLAQQGQGINRNIDLSREGLAQSTPQYVQQIAQRYQGNLAATNALFGLLGQLARATGKPAPASTGNTADAVTGIVDMLKGVGMTDQQATTAIDQMLEQGGFNYGQDYETYTEGFDSIFQ